MKFLLFFTILQFHINSYSFLTFNATILNTLNGKIQGKSINVTLSNVTSRVLVWQSVPYAEPPIKNLRFMNPVPVKPWKKIIDGTKPPKACMQPFLNKTNVSEDCLYLNIYSPEENYIKNVNNNNKSSLLPILVWMHGGFFRYGSSSDYDGSIFSAKSNIIVITLNYRLGLFGFFHMNGTDANGNQALLDQNLALKWIYDNAKEFGGDKNRITISGESAGYHLIFSQSWPYFNNAILQSGNPIALNYETLLLTSDEANHLAVQISSKLGCSNIECVQSIDKEVLNQHSEMVKLPSFVLGNDSFNQHPKKLFSLGKFKRCNVLLGFNNYEELSLAEREIGKDLVYQMIYGDFNSFKTAVKKRLNTSESIVNKILKFYIPINKAFDKASNYYKYFINMITDYQYKCTTYQLAEYLFKYNVQSYVYMFAHRSSISSQPPISGAAHSEEIPFTFGYPLAFKEDFSSHEQLFTEKIVNYWSNFILNDRPTLDNEWPTFNNNKTFLTKNLFYLKGNSIRYVKMNIDQKCLFWNNFKTNFKCSNTDCLRSNTTTKRRNFYYYY